MAPIHFLLNDRPETLDMAPGLSTLSWLRETRELTGTKEGCAEGECGACAVLLGELDGDHVNYRAVPACLLPLGELAGRHLVTIEGLNPPAGLHPIQQALVDEGAPQCGFCFPGIVISLAGFFLTSKDLSVADAVDSLDGNICRCTGYAAILRALTGLCETFAPRLDTHQPRVDQVLAWGLLPDHFSQAASRLTTMAPSPDPVEPEADLVAGSTDLLVQCPDDLATRPLSFISRRSDLRTVVRTAFGLELGGGVTLEQWRRSDDVEAVLPGARDMATLFASTLVRNRATVAGNLVNASPIGDLTVFLLAHDAELELAGPDAARRVPLADFYRGYKDLDLEPGEVVRAVHVPGLPAGATSNFEKISQRRILDIASVNGAAVLTMDDGVFTQARLSLGGVAPVPLLLKETPKALVGQPVSAATLLAAAAVQDAEIAPIDDVRGTAVYKRELARRILFAHILTLAPENVRLEELV